MREKMLREQGIPLQAGGDGVKVKQRICIAPGSRGVSAISGRRCRPRCGSRRHRAFAGDRFISHRDVLAPSRPVRLSKEESLPLFGLSFEYSW